MSNANEIFKEWEKFDRSLIEKHDGGYSSYSEEEKYGLYLKMVELIHALKKDSISNIDLSELELNEESSDLASGDIAYDLFSGGYLTPKNILVKVPEGLEKAIDVVDDYLRFLEENLEEM